MRGRVGEALEKRPIYYFHLVFFAEFIYLIFISTGNIIMSSTVFVIVCGYLQITATATEIILRGGFVADLMTVCIDRSIKVRHK